MVWLIGAVLFVLYRVFYAGMKSKTLFRTTYQQNDVDKIMMYIFATGLFAFAWPIALPLYGIYKLGQRYNKEA